MLIQKKVTEGRTVCPGSLGWGPGAFAESPPVTVMMLVVRAAQRNPGKTYCVPSRSKFMLPCSECLVDQSGSALLSKESKEGWALARDLPRILRLLRARFGARSVLPACR